MTRPPEHGEIAELVLVEQNRLLFSALPSALLATVVLAVVTALALWEQADPRLLSAWLAATGVVALARWQLWRRHRRAGPVAAAVVPYWRRRYLLGVLSGAGLWGTAGVALLPGQDLVGQVFIAFVIAGVSAGAVASLAADRAIALAFVIPSVLPMALELMTSSGRIGLAMGAMCLFYLSFIFAITQRSYNQLCANVTLRAHADARERQRERSEADMHQALGRLNSVLNAATQVAIIATDVDGIITIFNAGAERMLGYRADEVVGKHTPALVHLTEEIDARSRELSAELGRPVRGFEVFSARAEDGEVEASTWTYVRKDGSRLTVELRITPVAGEGGDDRAGWLGIAVDISERLEAHRQMALARAQLETFIAYAPAAVAMFDRELCCIAHSQRWVADYGLQGQVLVGHSLYELFPKTSERWRQIHQRCLRGAVERREQDLYVHPDGRRQWLCWEGRPWRDAGGHIGGIVMYAEDITAQVRAREELQQLNDRLSLATQAGGLGVWEWDLVKDTVLWDARMYQIYGLPAGDDGPLDALVPTREIHPDDFAEVRRQFLQALQSADGYDFEYRIVRPDGEERVVRSSALLSRNEDGRAVRVTGVNWDITESKKVERLKSEFVATVSHELRTPLTSIRGTLGLLAGGAAGELPVKAGELIQIAHRNSERLSVLINDLLDIEKIESGRLRFVPQWQPLQPLLEQAVEANRGFAHTCNVEFELVPPLPAVLVEVDSDRLLQVMANLLSNAAKFSPAGERVLVTAMLRGRTVRVVVQDRGPGVPEQFQPRLFQKFSQADASDSRAKGGTGLGLAITKAIVERMGGHIGFESKPDTGATFYFELPCAPLAVQPPG